MSRTTLDVLVVGAGVAGIRAVDSMRRLGLRVAGVERASDFGGTWYWNRYPGLRCDVESTFYSYSFDPAIEQEWTWSEKFATGDEIRAYLEWVVERLGVRPLFRFGEEVLSAHWDDDTERWTVRTDQGTEYDTRWIIWATGILSTPVLPEFPGQDEFEGPILDAARWPHTEPDLDGRRVAVLGAGSTAIQIVPEIVHRVSHLSVLQRTPSWSIPAHNRPRTPEQTAEIKANYRRLRRDQFRSQLGALVTGRDCSALEVSEEERQAAYWESYNYGSPMLYGATFADLFTNAEANATASAFIADRIRERVGDPQLAERMIPDYPVLTRRLCVDTDYYESFRLPHVELVDLREEPIERFTRRGIATSKRELAIDVLIRATGFDALTGTLRRIDIVGRGGRRLADHWADGPRTYLGLAVAGFPNMWLVTGPGSPSASSNMMASIEQHIAWITDMAEWLLEGEAETFEASPEAEAAWAEHVAEVGAATLLPRTNSWYVGANVPGKPRVLLQYMGGVGGYGRRIAEVAERGYLGFTVVGMKDPGILTTIRTGTHPGVEAERLDGTAA